MPSKKKKSSRGKSRKRDNRKNEEEEEEEQGPLDAQMERLKINDDTIDEATLLEEAIKLAAVEKEALGCSHGLLIVPEKDISIIKDFANTFIDGYNSVGAEAGVGEAIKAASSATAEKHPGVWNDPRTLKQAVSLFLANGTLHLLEEEEDIHPARLFASSAFFLQTRIACCSMDRLSRQRAYGTLPVGMLTKMIELTSCDLNTLVKYLRKISHVTAWTRSTKKSSLSQKWVCAGMTTVVYLIEWLNGAKCYTALGAVMQIIAPVNAKRPIGHITRNFVMKT
eukprot:scaffold6259_cov136-Skeletonema_dohrnii-CCMP3373.AAC.2